MTDKIYDQQMAHWNGLRAASIKHAEKVAKRAPCAYAARRAAARRSERNGRLINAVLSGLLLGILGTAACAFI